MERMFAALEPVRSDEGFVSIHFEDGVGAELGGEVTLALLAAGRPDADAGGAELG